MWYGRTFTHIIKMLWYQHTLFPDFTRLFLEKIDGFCGIFEWFLLHLVDFLPFWKISRFFWAFQISLRLTYSTKAVYLVIPVTSYSTRYSTRSSIFYMDRMAWFMDIWRYCRNSLTVQRYEKKNWKVEMKSKISHNIVAVIGILYQCLDLFRLFVLQTCNTVYRDVVLIQIWNMK